MLKQILAASAALLVLAGSARADALADCSQMADQAKTITGCSALIKEAAKDREKQALGYTNRAAAQQAKGDLKAALSDYTWALAASPKNAELWYKRGVVRSALGQNIRAAADQSLALRYDPKHVKALIERGESYRRLGALPKAVADATDALKLDPKSAAAYANRAYANLRLGKADLATADAGEALKLEPNNAMAYLARGLAQAKSDKAKAVADVKKALELKPGLKEAEAALKALGS